MMTREVHVSGVQDRRLADQALEHCGLQVVEHDFLRHAEHGEGVLVTGEEVLHGLRDGELDIHLARVAQHHHEEGELAPGRAHGDGAVFTPVDLCAFA